MADPTQLEQSAEQLRALARDARTKAGALATHLDGVVRTAGDDELWQGPYPRDAAGDLRAYQTLLVSAADLLGEDAAAWDAKARGLDADAAEAREEQRREREKRQEGTT